MRFMCHAHEKSVVHADSWGLETICVIISLEYDSCDAHMKSPFYMQTVEG